MFRTQAEPVSAWEAALPAEVLRLPEELARVDALLDDPVFFAPFAQLLSWFDAATHRFSAAAALAGGHQVVADG
jgi:hypothetical protein